MANKDDGNGGSEKGQQPFWVRFHQWIVPVLLVGNIIYTVGIMDQRIEINRENIVRIEETNQRQWDRILESEREGNRISERLAKLEGGLSHVVRQVDRLVQNLIDTKEK